jgi:hypothetical protein
MLRHFLEVSRTMPPEQGQRYLQWVEQQTCLSGQPMERLHKNGDSNSMADQPHM